MKKNLVLFLMALLISATTYAQTAAVKGQVVDDMNEAIIGASVVIKGTSQGTVTDLDGNFTV